MQNMNLQQVAERLAALDIEVRDATTVEAVEALGTEKRELLERKSELETLEARKQTALDITAGKIIPEVIEIRKENQMETKTFDIASEEYRSAWLKTLQGNPLTEAEQRAYATTDSGNAVPTITSDRFFEKMKKIAPMLSEITLLRVAGNLKFSIEGTNNAAALHTENTAVTPAADTIVNVTLGAYEFMKVIRISKSVQTMAVAAFEGWLVDMLSRDIARAIDNYIINDTTNGIAVCTTWTSGTNCIINTNGLTYANVVSLIAMLPAAHDASAKFLLNKSTLWNKIASLVDSAGNPILLTDMANGFQKTILGYPVLVDDYVESTKASIYLGDFTQVVGNLSQDIIVDRSTESGFLNNSVDFRGTAMFDSKVANTSAVVRFTITA